MSRPAYSSKEDEFWYNVSQQEELPLAGTIDLKLDVSRIFYIFKVLSTAENHNSAKDIIATNLLSDSSLFHDMRLFLGISNKRAYLELSFIASRTEHPNNDYGLCGCHPWTLARHPMDFFLRLLSGSKGEEVQHATADMLADYLLHQGLFDAAKGFSVADKNLLELIYTRLIIPKEYQQKAAKRRGHGCEAALARVLSEAGATIAPHDRWENPMGANDPHLNVETMTQTDREAGVTHAFDLLVLDGETVKIAIQSLIHTSDPGQYGVDKRNETVEVSRRFTEYNQQNSGNAIELWGLVDGVGFSENKRDTINKLLRHFETFLQIKTLYKGPLKLHKLGLVSVSSIRFSDYYDHEDIESIMGLYGSDDISIISANEQSPAGTTEIDAGEAKIYV
ncbi:MAG: hypothetical protein OXL41_08630 [Nitrospinae bacterium]|nr:hypothetical protein [Nitrospinota bacterium]